MKTQIKDIQAFTPNGGGMTRQYGNPSAGLFLGLIHRRMFAPEETDGSRFQSVAAARAADSLRDYGSEGYTARFSASGGSPWPGDETDEELMAIAKTIYPEFEIVEIDRSKPPA